MHLPNNTLLQGGKYKIIRFISAGGFGCTYEAMDTVNGRRVAIKELFVKDVSDRDENTLTISAFSTNKSALLDKVKRKFLEEANALRAMSHLNIVKVFDSFEENGTAYYVMEYIDGMSLHDMVKRNGPLPEDKAVKYIKQVAKALEYVHGRNRLHLDIKPGNIMIDQNDNAILIDFGVSKQYDEANGESTSTVLGKAPGYSPIEQLGNNIQHFTPATDIYALGATLYKCVTGNTPPDATTVLTDGLPTLPAGLKATTKKTIRQSIKPKVTERPQSIGQFMDCFKASSQPKPSPKPESPHPYPTPTKENSSVWKWVIGGIAIVVALFIWINSDTTGYQTNQDYAYSSHENTEGNGTKELTQKETELKVLLDKYNKDIAQGYCGDWNLLNNVNGIRRTSDMRHGQIMPDAITYNGVLYFDGNPITNDFNEPQKWTINLEGPRAGAYIVTADCDMMGYFEDDIDKYLKKIGCQAQNKVNLPYGWYKIYKYKNVYVGLYAGSSGNHGNNIGILFIQDKDYVPDAINYMTMMAE